MRYALLTLICAAPVTSQAQAAPEAAPSRPQSVEERATYWCLADRFYDLARTSPPNIARPAERTAVNYERAAPSPEQYPPHWRSGMLIEAKHGDVSCTTRVR